MGSSQLYSLAWGEFGTSLVSTVQLLRCHGDLVDVTLAAGGRSFPAHKIVLSAASPFLLDLIKSTPCKHPVLLLAGVAAHDLEALLEFVYRGEVSVDPNQLPSLLQAAHYLNIQGLASAAVASEKLEELSAGSAVHQNLTRDVINSFLPSRRRKRNRHKSGGSSQEGGPGNGGSEGGKWARGDRDDGIVGGSDGGGDDPDDIKVSTGPQRAASDGEAPAGTNGEDFSVQEWSSPNSPEGCSHTPKDTLRVLREHRSAVEMEAKKSGVSDQPAICPLCGATIRQSRNLRRHLELLHFGASTTRGGSLRVKSRSFSHQPMRPGEPAMREGSSSPIPLISPHQPPISMVVPANPLMVVGSGDRLGLADPSPGLLGPQHLPHPLTIPTPTDLMLRRHHDADTNSPLYADSRTSRSESPTASTSHSAIGGDVV